jgi:hypothetical protein
MYQSELKQSKWCGVSMKGHKQLKKWAKRNSPFFLREEKFNKKQNELQRKYKRICRKELLMPQTRIFKEVSYLNNLTCWIKTKEIKFFSLEIFAKNDKVSNFY